MVVSKKVVFEINLLNVQGLTQAKMIEVESYIRNDNCFFLIETHQKREQIRYSKDIRNLQKMRKIDDKKGGGGCCCSQGGSIIRRLEMLRGDRLSSRQHV